MFTNRHRPLVAAGLLTLGVAPLCTWSTSAQNAAPNKADLARQALLRFAAAIRSNDLKLASEVLPTPEDLKGLFEPAECQIVANRIRSRATSFFEQYTAALKIFGEHDMLEVTPGKPKIIPKGAQKNLVDIRAMEDGVISYVKNCDALIELKIRVGGMMECANGKWVVSNLTSRQELIDRLELEKRR
ncbi:MAG: hypothetical protein CHACPFDD_02431 [Phycisphaerae bacterium]|nr:hypothetical protein [Phycisphaerae bacterium]